MEEFCKGDEQKKIKNLRIFLNNLETNKFTLV
jgi:hypothetical protein